MKFFWLVFTLLLAPLAQMAHAETNDTPDTITWDAANAQFVAQMHRTGKKIVTYPAGQRAGTATNDDACAGCEGEAKRGAAGLTNLPATTVWGDCANTGALSAGDWDITTSFLFSANGGTVTQYDTGISATTGNFNTGLVLGDNWLESTSALTGFWGGSIANFRVKIASGTPTYYAKVKGTFSAGAPQAACRISARRAR